MSARAHALFAAFAGGGRAEVLSCDEAYIDLRGLGAAGAEAAVRRLRGDVFAATGCTVSAGIGRNKLLARVATKRAKPDGLFVAPQDEAGVAAFLHALPAAELPGVGYWVEARLAELLLQAPGAGAGAGAGMAAPGSSLEAAAAAAGAAEENEPPVNERALAVLRRVQAKLTGRDFAEDDPIGHVMSQGIGAGGADGPGGGAARGAETLDTAAQVQRLVLAAVSTENLAVAYIGWCSSW